MKKLVVSMLLLACATQAARAENLSVKVVKQPEIKWQFRQLQAYVSDTTTRVSGRLTSFFRFGLPSGHIDLAAYSRSGELIDETTTDYEPRILTRRAMRKGGARFAVSFKQLLPSDAIIKVAFHREEPRPKINPPHKQNIAK